MNAVLRLSLFAVLALLPACGQGSGYVYAGATVTVPASEASLFVVATDGNGYAIEGVSVEVLNVWHEWSGDRVSPSSRFSGLLTDRHGEAFFSPVALARMRAGFLLDEYGNAVISSDPFEDEASLRVRVSAGSLGYVEVDVDVDQLHSAAYLEVEF
ncbi:MAG: hypothetical protein CSA62_01080 [Planctomycetota bacterium]|nr:MAG: hypothetical protein CSA62_01080 [Planctomycetota bacterium]